MRVDFCVRDGNRCTPSAIVTEKTYLDKGCVRLNKRKKRAILDWIKREGEDIMGRMKDTSKRAVDAARRIAFDAWLQIHNR